MTIHAEKRIGPNFGEIVCQGLYTTSSMLDIVDDALEFAADNGLNAVLIDWCAITGAPDVLERFDLGSNFAELQLSKTNLVRVALVGNEPQIDPERFGETVARNRYGVIRVFDDRAKAQSWLKPKSD